MWSCCDRYFNLSDEFIIIDEVTWYKHMSDLVEFGTTLKNPKATWF